MFERLIQRTYDALGRKDASAIMRTLSDDAVFELGGRSTISGRYEGHAAIEAFFGRLFERMAEIEATVEHVGFGNPLGFMLSNTTYVEWRVSETTKDGLSVSSNVISVMRVRRGKCVLLREYWLDDGQLEALWGRKPA